MPQKEIQNESHDWLADAAESLVRYYFAKTGKYYTYGAGKWGADCVLQDKETGKMLTVEVKSTDSNNKKPLIRSLKKKIAKLKLQVRPHMYAEVRFKEKKGIDINELKGDNIINVEFTISLWDINKNKCSVRSSRFLKAYV